MGRVGRIRVVGLLFLLVGCGNGGGGTGPRPDGPVDRPADMADSLPGEPSFDASAEVNDASSEVPEVATDLAGADAPPGDLPGLEAAGDVPGDSHDLRPADTGVPETPGADLLDGDAPDADTDAPVDIGPADLPSADADAFADSADSAPSHGPTCAGAIRVNVGASGEQAIAEATGPVVSADGRFVAFSSRANNLVPGDLNGRLDVFVKDTWTGAIERVNVSSAGEADGDSGFLFPLVPIAMTPDARFVAFSSIATNLVPGDTNGQIDVFVRDRQTQTTTRVSVTSSGAQVNGPSYSPSISADGTRIAFTSPAVGYDSRDSNGISDVFVHDRTTGTTRLLTVVADSPGGGGPAAGSGVTPVISASGAKVAFVSQNRLFVPANLRPPSSALQRPKVFVVDVASGVIQLVSLTHTGALPDGDSTQPSLSGDGNRVAFVSPGSNLVAGDSNDTADVFIRDIGAGTTLRASLRTDGTQSSVGSSQPRLNAAGGRTVFIASALHGGSPSSGPDVYVFDGATSRIILVSLGLGGSAAGRTGSDLPPDLTTNGDVVAFTSSADNLVVGDSNDAQDVFLARVDCP